MSISNLPSDEIESKIRYWFFKHLNEAQRINLIRLFVPGTIKLTHAQQGTVLEAMFDGLENEAKYNTLDKQYHELMQKLGTALKDNNILSDSIHKRLVEIDALRHRNDLLFKCLALTLQNNELGASAERLLSAVETYEQMGKSINRLDTVINSVGKE